MQPDHNEDQSEGREPPITVSNLATVKDPDEIGVTYLNQDASALMGCQLILPNELPDMPWSHLLISAQQTEVNANP